MWHNRTVLNYCYCNNPQPRNNQDFELTLHKILIIDYSAALQGGKYG
ncbi:hypothetical protein HMPREF1582_00998 [Gardnerella vaginalis JCP8151A]|nr:hypothetical protein HMPREF1582_00998 [Gardnerella vaginalis JCP8151A]